MHLALHGQSQTNSSTYQNPPVSHFVPPNNTYSGQVNYANYFTHTVAPEDQNDSRTIIDLSEATPEKRLKFSTAHNNSIPTGPFSQLNCSDSRETYTLQNPNFITDQDIAGYYITVEIKYLSNYHT